MKFLFQQWLFAVLLLTGFVACSKEMPVSGNETDATVQAAFKLQVKPVEEYFTRGAAVAACEVPETDDAMTVTFTRDKRELQTRASGDISENNEERVSNVWVLQFDGTNPEAKLVLRQFFSDLGSDYIVRPSLLHNSTEQTIYFLVNTNNSSLFSDLQLNKYTLANFEETPSRQYADQLEVTSNGTTLPMAAKYTGIPGEALKNITVTRMVSKITFSYTTLLPAGHSFVAKSVQLQDIPRTALYAGQLTGGVFPTEEGVNFTDYDMVNLAPGASCTWYMPESMRGEVPAVTQPGMKGAHNAPKFATNIVITGDYTKPGAQGEETQTVLYRIFLGENDTYSFNTRRNHHYTLNVVIRNMMESDKRVLVANNALARFATHDLAALNTFAEGPEWQAPVAYWQWGRNKAFPNAVPKANVERFISCTDPLLWETDAMIWRKSFSSASITSIFNNINASYTWSDVVKSAIGTAPESYIGNNTDYLGNLSGDPCPQGWHVPDDAEYQAITIQTNDATIRVGGKTGVYSGQKTTNAGVTYGLKFIQDNNWDMLTAYRWEKVTIDGVDCFKITSRYLGLAGRKITVADLVPHTYWSKNNAQDVVRYFPVSGIYTYIKKENASSVYRFASDYIKYLSMGADYSALNVFAAKAGFSSQSNKQSVASSMMPVRCVRN